MKVRRQRSTLLKRRVLRGPRVRLAYTMLYAGQILVARRETLVIMSVLLIVHISAGSTEDQSAAHPGSAAVVSRSAELSPVAAGMKSWLKWLLILKKPLMHQRLLPSRCAWTSQRTRSAGLSAGRLPVTRTTRPNQ